MMYVRYKNDPEIVAMTELIDAQRRRDIHAAMKIINSASLPNHIPPAFFRPLRNSRIYPSSEQGDDLERRFHLFPHRRCPKEPQDSMDP